MIESAAQVLLSVSNSKNNVDKTAMFRNNNAESGFGDVFSQSKSQAIKKRENSNENRDQFRNAGPSNTEQRSNAKTSNNENANKVESAEKNDRSPSNRVDGKESEKIAAKDNANASAGEIDSKTKKSSEDAAKDTPQDDTAKKTAKEVIENAVANIAEDAVSSDGGDVKEVVIENWQVEAAVEESSAQEKLAVALISDSLKADASELAVDGEVLKASIDPVKDGKLASELKQLSQAITNEFEASKNKSNEFGSASVLSRSKISSEIELALANTDAEKNKLNNDKILKPELVVNVNASKVLSEQIKTKDLSPIDLEPELIVEGDDELASSLETPTDALLDKMLQRLDVSKLKVEDNQFAKITADKTAIADFVEQLSVKAGAEASAGSLLSAANTLSGKAGIMPAPQQMALNTNINQAQWGTDFSKRIQFMISNDIKHAELRLDPPELGRINIKISMNQDQATVVFTSAQGNVRETIENTLPKLREMLQESGIQLGEANVNEGQKDSDRQASNKSNAVDGGIAGIDGDIEQEIKSRPIIEHSVDGVIDYFA